jgi:hypothetical protein
VVREKIVEATDEKQEGVLHKPARLYRIRQWLMVFLSYSFFWDKKWADSVNTPGLDGKNSKVFKCTFDLITL